MMAVQLIVYLKLYRIKQFQMMKKSKKIAFFLKICLTIIKKGVIVSK